MIHDGIKCKRSRVWGWREGNPETDVDLHGKSVDNIHFVIVSIKDCPQKTSVMTGRPIYLPQGVKQAFPLAYGGTCYGYGKPQKIVNGTPRMIRCGSQMEWLNSYLKTPVYVVNDGKVHIGHLYRKLVEGKQVHRAA